MASSRERHGEAGFNAFSRHAAVDTRGDHFDAAGRKDGPVIDQHKHIGYIAGIADSGNLKRHEVTRTWRGQLWTFDHDLPVVHDRGAPPRGAGAHVASGHWAVGTIADGASQLTNVSRDDAEADGVAKLIFVDAKMDFDRREHRRWRNRARSIPRWQSPCRRRTSAAED